MLFLFLSNCLKHISIFLVPLLCFAIFLTIWIKLKKLFEKMGVFFFINSWIWGWRYSLIMTFLMVLLLSFLFIYSVFYVFYSFGRFGLLKNVWAEILQHNTHWLILWIFSLLRHWGVTGWSKSFFLDAVLM